MAPVVAGLPMTANLQFEIIDAVIPAGHHLGLWMSSTGREYLATTTSAAVQINGGTLALPTIPAGHGLEFTPPEWSGDAAGQDQQP
jgi:hypothetical protein